MGGGGWGGGGVGGCSLSVEICTLQLILSFNVCLKYVLDYDLLPGIAGCGVWADQICNLITLKNIVGASTVKEEESLTLFLKFHETFYIQNKLNV